MANSLEATCSGAVLSALFAGGCLSTGEPLFREDGTLEAENMPVEMDPPTPPAASADARPAAAPQTSEQLFAPGRDVAPPALSPAPAEGAGDESAAEGEAVPEPGEPAALEPCALEGLILCDSFEGALEGAFPTTGGWLPELSGCGSHVVDGAGPSFSGSKALRVDDGGYPECMLHADSSGPSDVYVRTRVYLGAGDALVGQYLSLLEFGVSADRDDPELRIGVRPANDNVCPGAPGVDVTGTGMMAGPATECTGFALEPERWYCIESRLSRSGTTLGISLSVDGAELVTRDFLGTDGWDQDDLFVKVGRAAYGASGTGAVWHDDVAVSRQPVPCGP